MPTPVTTVCLSFLGTAEHRDDAKHAVINFHNKILETEGVAARLFDGPGSSPSTSGSAHPTPGTYIYNPSDDSKTILPSAASALRDALMVTGGQLAGEGVDDLLLEASLYVQKMKAENPAIETINLHGFSRGADACVRMANLLNQLYPDIKVNLFLFDQVPGPNRRDDPHSYTIPPNVQRFESALMMHEYRPGFDAQHGGRYTIASPGQTNVSILPFFGEHWTGILQTGNINTSHSAKILHNRFLKFCQDTGSLPETARPLAMSYGKINGRIGYQSEGHPEMIDNSQVFNHYCDMLENEWLYSKGTRMNTRSLLSQRAEHTRDSGLFVNQDHRELFQTLYPKTFSWFFEGNIDDHSEEEVKQELETIQPQEYLERFQTYFKIESQASFPRPQGPRRKERESLGKPPLQPDNELSSLSYGLRAAANYFHYHHSEKSSTDKATHKAIVDALKESEKQTETVAIQTLKTCISQQKTALTSQRKSYFMDQLNQIEPNVDEYYQKIATLLNPRSGFYLSDIQHNLREGAETRCRDIMQSDDSSRNRYLRLQSELITLNAQLVPSTDESRLLLGDVQRSADEFRDKLSALAQPEHGEESLASRLAASLDGYLNRNRFWKTVQAVFKSIHLPFPTLYSREKEMIAEQLRDRAMALHNDHKGNDLVENRQLLTLARQALNQLYSARPLERLFTGTFDRLIEKAQGNLGAKAALHHPAVTTETETEERPDNSASAAP